jgi:isoquinoline 1-oxidoreductase alpha subunit
MALGEETPMPPVNLVVNGQNHTVDVADGEPLLWVLRDKLGLVGTKFGCGASLCGACTVHVDGQARRSCITPAATVEGASITTIEGLASADGTLHALQEAWIENDVAQCGYCQAGQIMAAAALLSQNSAPSDAEIDAAMAGNLCRCATYNRIRAGIHAAAAKIQAGG